MAAFMVSAEAELLLKLRYNSDRYRFTYAEVSMLQGRIRYLARRKELFGIYAKVPTTIESLYPPGFKPSGKGRSPLREAMYLNPFTRLLPKS